MRGMTRIHVSRRGALRRWLTVVLAAGLTTVALTFVGTLVSIPSATAAPVSLSQCDSTGVDAGDTISCTITVTNEFAYNAATPTQPTGTATIVTENSCTGSASCPITGTPTVPAPITTTSTSPVTSIDQCNTAGLGGASNITCTVTVTNDLTGYPTGSAIAPAISQCLTPGATVVVTCTLNGSSNVNGTGSGGPSGQSVTQCNSSGGALGALTCTITASATSQQSTGLPTTISQCGASGTTGASILTCTATITNNFSSSTAPLAVAAIATAPSSNLFTVGGSVDDVATVTGNVTNGTPTGTVQFYDCGAASTVCTAVSGTALGAPVALTGGVATSPSFTPAGAGYSCFAAVYTPDGATLYSTSEEDGSITDGECPVVSALPGVPPPATVTTTAPSSNLFTLGNSVDDVATVTGNVTNGTPTGTVQFYDCGALSTVCSSTSGTALGAPATLSGGLATSPTFTPVGVGYSCFAAVYIPAAGSPYSASSESGSILDGECPVVSAVPGVPPALTPPATVTTTAPTSDLFTLGGSVNDVATVTGNATNGTPTGTVQFYDCGSLSIVCSSTLGTALGTPAILSGGLATSPTFTPVGVGYSCFAAVYIPAAGSPYSASSEAGSILDGECPVVSAVPGVPPALTPPPTVTTSAASDTVVALGKTITDVATVTGNATNGAPTGTVQFYECGPPSILCSSASGTALRLAAALSGGVATSPAFTPASIGTYCFSAVYIPAVGSPYSASSEAGSSTNGECFSATAAAVTVTPAALVTPVTPAMAAVPVTAGTTSTGTDASAASSAGVLAFTGLDIVALLEAAFVMLMAGMLLLVLAERHRRRSRA
jgi:hypothetical protein